jgi:hypothetical protein
MSAAIALIGVALLCVGCGDNGARPLRDAAPSSDSDIPVTVGDASLAVDALSDTGGRDGGLDTGPGLPTITALEPSTVFRGDSLEMTGFGFLPNPRTVIEGVTLQPTSASATDLTFTIPSDFPLAGCDEQLPIVVVTDLGTSAALSLLVRDPGPTFFPLANTMIPAGDVLTLTGCGLAGATVTAANGRALTELQAADTTISTTIPQGFATGQTTLIVTTPRGQTQVAIQVLPPRPRVVSTDIPTVGPSGVVFVTTSATDHSQLTGVQIGSRTISPTDPSSFIWSPISGSPNVFAVRVPAIAQPGTVNMTLTGPSGTGPAFPLTVVAPAPVMPPPVATVVIPPTAAADGDTFPIGTTTPFPLDDPGATMPVTWGWSYYLSFTDPLDCSGNGIVAGAERYITQGSVAAPGSGSCDPTLNVCHPVTGTFSLTATSNTVNLTIDRTSSGGEKESYTGGWVAADGVSPVTATLPGGSGYNGPAYLVLRSLRTGIQLSIQHGVNVTCNQI